MRSQSQELIISKLHPELRSSVKSILDMLESIGYPSIVASGLRTYEHQRMLVQKGFSKTMKSKHLPDKNGYARAADIVPKKYGWKAPKAYWLILAHFAIRRGLRSGIFFGLSKKDRVALETYLYNPEIWSLLKHGAPDWLKIGWDPAHMEMK